MVSVAPAVTGIHVRLGAFTLGGYYFSKCSCGVVSDPCVYEEDAELWRCEIGEAEAAADRHLKTFLRIEADAMNGRR